MLAKQKNRAVGAITKVAVVDELGLGPTVEIAE